MRKNELTGALYPVSYYLGLVAMTLGALQLIPALTSLVYREWNILMVFLCTASIALILGLSMMMLGFSRRREKLSFGVGLSVSAGAWGLGMLLCAIPYRLCGNYLSYLDSCFDVMSGLTTTGLTLVQNMDHLSNGVNMWRHLLTFLGGQGMIVLALTFLAKDAGGAYTMYVGEAKDEKLMPNAVSTSKRIWSISMFYLLIGSVVMSLAAFAAGMRGGRAILHGIWIYMSAWSTGGFGPMSQNVLYYHSALFELVTVVFFVIGSFNFALHHAVLSGNRKELVRNIETVTFTVTLTLTASLTALGLMRAHVYPNVMALFRKGFYQLISGHTTTGFMSIYAKQFYYEWGDIALFAITLAMLFGGSACSTAGGFKGIRTGIIFKTFQAEIRQMLQPDSRRREQRIHHIRDIILTDKAVRSAFVIVTAYIITFSIGTLAGMLAGYPLAMAAFESASATGNVGLSIGITAASMPAFLKVTYIIIMWLARLEFMSVLALIAYGLRKVKRSCSQKYW
ncbi:MAG: TrkH family potassium uptake protein [Oscillibacter sp.]|jgi:trk system potassium uptake protein TrkH|nr:TrkH family potassium uptake protein [Oscillibacter sp.]